MLKRTSKVEVDSVDFRLLIVQIAATVLFICETRSPQVFYTPEREDPAAYDPIAIILNKYERWAAHGFTNSLQAMVELLYDYVKVVIEEDANFLGRHDRIIVADALTAYQQWKTDHIASEKEKLGYEHWGDESVFSKMNWTDQNEKFLGSLSASAS